MFNIALDSLIIRNSFGLEYLALPEEELGIPRWSSVNWILSRDKAETDCSYIFYLIFSQFELLVAFDSQKYFYVWLKLKASDLLSYVLMLYVSVCNFYLSSVEYACLCGFLLPHCFIWQCHVSTLQNDSYDHGSGSWTWTSVSSAKVRGFAVVSQCHYTCTLLLRQQS